MSASFPEEMSGLPPWRMSSNFWLRKKAFHVKRCLDATGADPG